MGAVNSCCIPRRSFEECRENRISTPRKKGHRRNLSATFNFSFGDDESAETADTLLNVNTATEEELMTLPGVNRATAQNIIDYRRQIGNFKKVEDLALVSGVGATKLSHIRTEIYISTSKRTPSLRSDSPNGSKSDVNSTSSSCKDRKKSGSVAPLKVNVNTANVFQLMKVKGLGQTMAENIVIYREKRGLYKSIDDLVKVKGIRPNVLSAIKHSLALVDSQDSTPQKPQKIVYTNGDLPNHSNNNNSLCSCNGSVVNNNNNNTRGSMENVLDILGPFSSSPIRTTVVPYNFTWKNKRAVRIASWNLERFSDDKSKHPGVLDVVAMTILENGFGIVAVQELASETALNNICDELNSPTLPNNRKWSGHRGKWKVAVSESTGHMFQGMEYNAFLYDTSQKVELVSCALLKKPVSGVFPFVRQPFICVFRINKKLDCVVVSVHLKATGLRDEHLDETKKDVQNINSIISAIEQQIPGEKDIIIVGDFHLTRDIESEKDFKVLTSRGYIPCIPPSIATNISANNPRGSDSYDNIWIGKRTKKVYTGRYGVVRDGLASPWIPDGWTWGGVVSDHCPVYAEFCSNKDLDNGKITSDGPVFTIGGGNF